MEETTHTPLNPTSEPSILYTGQANRRHQDPRAKQIEDAHERMIQVCSMLEMVHAELSGGHEKRHSRMTVGDALAGALTLAEQAKQLAEDASSEALPSE